MNEIKAGKEKLLDSAQKLFAKMYEQTAGAGQARRAAAGRPGPQAARRKAGGTQAMTMSSTRTTRRYKWENGTGPY